MDRNKKNDDEGYIPFQSLDKGLVLQEKNIFSATPLDPKKCCQLLTKILYLIVQGEKLSKNEATDVFFAVTKLFQSKDIPLRRMVYLVLKELMKISEDVIIVMSCLTKDINSKVDIYKANSIRVLCGITDGPMLTQVERYLKQSIVDKEPYVSSAALVSGIHLIKQNPEIVKRWVHEVQEALQSRSVMVQYHALGLLHQIRKHDKLAVSKLVVSMIKTNIRSPYAHCLLIRMASQLIQDDPNASQHGYFNYIETCLRHNNEMVIYEAARAISNLPRISAREISPSITILQLFLNSPKPSLRFAAIRTLSKIAQIHDISKSCNLDMENLISDPNRSIATLAITTLLKTGNEESIDRLMKQISSFMDEISDEFKIVVVEAIRGLSVKYPQKHQTLVSFLASLSRNEGGFEYKRAIVETILQILRDIPEAKETAMNNLCEFIEDCEFPYLSIKILYLLGVEGPSTSTPSRYIRYIYNRITLEYSSVRAAAVSALAKFAIQLADLRPSVLVLLKRCLYDNDDEVRDRATFYVKLLEKGDSKQQGLYSQEFKIPIINLQRALIKYKENPSAEPFNIKTVSVIPPQPVQKEDSPAQPVFSTEPVVESQEVYAALLSSIEEFSNLGPLFKSSKPIPLTEPETEYVVTCVKHIFKSHIVLQFNITNTVEEQVLENVTVKSEVNFPGLKTEFMLPLDSLPYGEAGQLYVCLSKAPNSFPMGTIQSTLKFLTREVDATTGELDESGFDDEYQIEELEISASDYVQKTFVTNFEEKWEEMEELPQIIEGYGLTSVKDLSSAVKTILDFLGMQAANRTDRIPAKRTKHILQLSGNFIGEFPVLAITKMKLSPDSGVQFQLIVRSPNESVCQAIISAI